MAWYFHNLPQWINHLSTAVMFVIECVLPIFYLIPLNTIVLRRTRLLAAWSTIILMILIMITGNYNFFNVLTIVLCFSLFDETHMEWLLYPPMVIFYKIASFTVFGDRYRPGDVSYLPDDPNDGDVDTIDSSDDDDEKAPKDIKTGKMGKNKKQRKQNKNKKNKKITKHKKSKKNAEISANSKILLCKDGLCSLEAIYWIIDIIVWLGVMIFTIYAFQIRIKYDGKNSGSELIPFIIDSSVNFDEASLDQYTSFMIFFSICFSYVNIGISIFYDLFVQISNVYEAMTDRRMFDRIDDNSIILVIIIAYLIKAFNFLFSNLQLVLLAFRVFIGIVIFHLTLLPFIQSIETKYQYSYKMLISPQQLTFMNVLYQNEWAFDDSNDIFGLNININTNTNNNNNNKKNKNNSKQIRFTNTLPKLHIVNTYGLFRRMTGVGGRPEIEIYVTDNGNPLSVTEENIIDNPNDASLDQFWTDSKKHKRLMKKWFRVPFLYKPGRMDSVPNWIWPHQARLDWQMWFAALGNYNRNPWFLSLIWRILDGKTNVALIDLIDTSNFLFSPLFVNQTAIRIAEKKQAMNNNNNNNGDNSDNELIDVNLNSPFIKKTREYLNLLNIFRATDSKNPWFQDSLEYYQSKQKQETKKKSGKAPKKESRKENDGKSSTKRRARIAKTPKYITAVLYWYHYTDYGDSNGMWWTREYKREYLPIVEFNKNDKSGRENPIQKWMQENGFFQTPIYFERSHFDRLSAAVRHLRMLYRKVFQLGDYVYGPVVYIWTMIATSIALRICNEYVRATGDFVLYDKTTLMLKSV